MSQQQVIEVKVPDIGDFTDVPVIDVLVKPGDAVAKEDPLVTLESDKATMEVPAPAAGVVKELKVKVGDKVSEGAPILTLEAAPAAKPGAAAFQPARAAARVPTASPPSPALLPSEQ
jgi:pyruvate/2-oxoglutarate dehydrogenase complex dihydrolipoamide acyltransferase (E2) component